MFNCPRDERSLNFQWFYGFQNLKMGFSATVKGNHSHMVLIDTPLHVDGVIDASKLLWHKVFHKHPSLKPSRLTVSSFGQHESCNRNYGRTMYMH